jgi:hypothetical protein
VDISLNFDGVEYQMVTMAASGGVLWTTFDISDHLAESGMSCSVTVTYCAFGAYDVSVEVAGSASG